MSRPTLPFTSPWLLAPMEGVTDPTFRGCVFELHDPSHLGGAFTEFVRISNRAMPKKVLLRHLGETRHAIPVGLQIMASDPGLLAQTARTAVELGAPLIDLNFGCPAKTALKGCVGSALLREPETIRRLIHAAVREVGDEVPVTAKLRAGFDHDRDVETLARCVEDGGASLMTLHCRTRLEGYRPVEDWDRIRRAVRSIDIPVCGNGGIQTHSDLTRIVEETGCQFAMIGRATLGNPWIFSGKSPTTAEAAGFLRGYLRVMIDRSGVSMYVAVRRVKQLLNYWCVGDIVQDEDDRRTWLRETSCEAFVARLEALTPPTEVAPA